MKTAHDLVAAAKTRVQEVSVDQAEQAIRNADVLIDVREADEFQAGHLPGAKSPRSLRLTRNTGRSSKRHATSLPVRPSKK